MSEQSLPAGINSEPCFEGQGGWSAGYQLAKNEGPGVTVGPGTANPNVFAQGFAVDSQKYFRLVARARSVKGQPGKAKFQINWLAEDKQFIQASQKSFNVTDREITSAECRVKVPEGAVTGVIYVGPGDEVNPVQYYEMSLYPDSGPEYRPVSNSMHRSGSAKRSYSTGLLNRKMGGTERPEGFWENFGRNNPLCFVHIPKAAGHSVYSLFEKNYPENVLMIPYRGVEGNIEAILDLLPGEIKKTKVIAAHMPFGAHNYIGECSYLTFLRDPFDMVVSRYYFNMESTGAPGHAVEVDLNKTLLQFAECADNVMTRFLMNCAFQNATFWLSGETKPNVDGVSYLGLDCTNAVNVRTVALQQWSAVSHQTRFPAPGVMERVAVECSDDNFKSDIRLVAELRLKQDRELHAYGISSGARGRFWRVRALSGAQTARWGVVALRFFEQEASAIPPINYEHLALRGEPLCSSATKNYPAANAFDGHDRRAQGQVPPHTLEMCHCEEAMNNLRERFLVGLVEKYDQSIGMMGKVLDWSYMANEKRNMNAIARNASILSDYERKQVAEINRYDLLLYKYAQKLFQSDLGNLRAMP